MSQVTAKRFTERVRERIQRLLPSFTSFGIIGAISFVIDSSIFNFLLFYGAQPLLDGHEKAAQVTAAVIATLFSWVANRSVSFRDRKPGGNVGRELVSFFGINFVAIMISMTCVAVNHDVLGNTSALSANIANYGIGLPLGMVFRFVLYRFWLYPEAKPELATTTDEATPVG